MPRFRTTRLVGALTTLFLSQAAYALDLDWSGQFWAEYHSVWNANLDLSSPDEVDASRLGANGYYIPSTGSGDATFQSLFMRLKPRAIVNDNIYLKSEWWLGDPVFGFFGNSVPYTVDQKQWYSTQSRGSTIRAQRFWAELITDYGTISVGRAPLDWGLGVVWNSGDELFSRYMSTGDLVRLESKFGPIFLGLGYIKHNINNSIGTPCTFSGDPAVCTGVLGDAQVTDYAVTLKYENLDEDFEAGVNLIKRIAGSDQDPDSGHRIWGSGEAGATQSAGGMNYNVWDIFVKKRAGSFTLGAEAPVVSGSLGGADYSTWALALEGEYRFTDTWFTSIKAGRASGQGNIDGDEPETFRAFYFHPGYKLGMIMFNYQFRNFAGPNTLNNAEDSNPSDLLSPYDNPIVNAVYAAWTLGRRTNQWDYSATFVYAKALETARAGSNFFNTWTRDFELAAEDQDSAMGWELDLGATYRWDDHFRLGGDLGVFFPGDFFAFSNTADPNATSRAFAFVLRAGVDF